MAGASWGWRLLRVARSQRTAGRASTLMPHTPRPNAALGDYEHAVADYRAYLQLTPEANDRTLIETWIAELT